MNAPPRRYELLRNPRAIVPASQRIRNWRTLPVEGAGQRPMTLMERFGGFIIVALAILAAWLCASQGWNW